MVVAAAAPRLNRMDYSRCVLVECCQVIGMHQLLWMSCLTLALSRRVPLCVCICVRLRVRGIHFMDCRVLAAGNGGRVTSTRRVGVDGGTNQIAIGASCAAVLVYVSTLSGVDSHMEMAPHVMSRADRALISQ